MTRRVTTPPSQLPPRLRLAAAGGIFGPAAFVGSWAFGGLVTADGYSAVDDAISRLAAVGADTRALMTAGFVGFGVGLPIYASALRSAIGGLAWTAAAATGVATLAVAATPLDRSAAVDTWHGVFAGLGYATLAATPLLAAGPLRRTGNAWLANFGLVAATVSATALVLTVGGRSTGLWQRIGLTAGDVWIATSAWAMINGTIGGASGGSRQRRRSGQRRPWSSARR